MTQANELAEFINKKISDMNKKVEALQKELAAIADKAEKNGEIIPLEQIASKYHLNQEEKLILLILYFDEFDNFETAGVGLDLLLRYLGYTPGEFIGKTKLVKNLLKRRLIVQLSDLFSKNPSVYDSSLQLSKSILRKLSGNELNASHRIFKKSRFPFFMDSPDEASNLLEIRKPLITFDQIVLDAEKEKSISAVLKQIDRIDTVFKDWGFNKTIKYGKGITMLFYGPPGTGKTATCEAIASSLGVKIGIARYDRIVNAYVGVSEKHVRNVFKQAKKHKCLLTFDEADALFAKRFDCETQSADRMHNTMTNILMQELEQYDGILILTTNREIIMDKAFNRRILLKLRFDIPGPEERTRIWRLVIPEKTPLSDDIDFNLLGSRYELSGGEIKNVLLNAAIDCANSGENKLTMAALIKYAEKEIEAKPGANTKIVF